MLKEPTRTQHETFSRQVDTLIGTVGMDRLVAAYFDPSPASRFAGFTFDTVGVGAPSDEVGAGDLLAVSLLDVRFKPPSLRALLEPGEVRTEVTGLLRKIPTDKDLWDDVDLRPADLLWDVLMALPDIGDSKAGKILAKKRPRLLPVYDGTVARAFAESNACYWLLLRRALSDGARRRKVDGLGNRVDRPVSALRLLDVAVWMSYSKSWDADKARTDLGVGTTRT